MSLQLVPLEDKHLEDAAALVSRRYQGLREQVVALPARYADVNTLLSLLGEIIEPGLGVAAIRGGRLVGFLAGWKLPAFQGKPSMFSPEWANGAELEHSRRLYEEMYTRGSAIWVAEGYNVHLISMLAHDHEGMIGWPWLGFGMVAADAVRDLQPIQAGYADVDIRRAGLQDLEQVMFLNKALRQHMLAAPIFLTTEDYDRADYEAWLQNPAQPIWLAYQGEQAVAYLELGPASEDACTIIVDEKTTSVRSAFTVEQVRGGGLATALLNVALAWARAQGYERCAVDFEPMNPWAVRFWLRHFQPVSYTFIRLING